MQSYHNSKMKEKIFFSFWDLNHGPLDLKASVLPMSYTGTFEYLSCHVPCLKYKDKNNNNINKNKNNKNFYNYNSITNNKKQEYIMQPVEHVEQKIRISFPCCSALSCPTCAITNSPPDKHVLEIEIEYLPHIKNHFF